MHQLDNKVFEVGPCLILPQLQTFTILALGETMELGYRTRVADCGGINRNENTFLLHGSFFLFRGFS